MSSKVLPPDDAAGAVRFAWKQVPRPESGAAKGPAGRGPDPAEATARLERQAEQRAREAHAAGFREGEAAGKQRAAVELEPVLERLTRSIGEMAGLRGGMRREAEADTLRLALEIARRVLRREMAVDPDALRGLVRAALEKLEGQEISRVKVHPSHAPLVSDLLRKSGAGQPVEVVADASQAPGAVIFESERGNLDASVDAQLGEIERGLADCLRRRA
ncbi:MAG: FliH/SctL family protein [Bryobacteraceae bacterium]|jgi:flagellar assembly protein FliH